MAMSSRDGVRLLLGPVMAAVVVLGLGCGDDLPGPNDASPRLDAGSAFDAPGAFDTAPGLDVAAVIHPAARWSRMPC